MNLETTNVDDLGALCDAEIKNRTGWKVYRAAKLDTFKLYTHAHGSKTTNLIINLDHEDWVMLDRSRTLASYGIRHESELSYFNRDDYLAFLLNPEERWQ